MDVYRLPPGLRLPRWRAGTQAGEWVVWHEGTGETLRLSAAAVQLLDRLAAGPCRRPQLRAALRDALNDPPADELLDLALDEFIEPLVKHELIEPCADGDDGRVVAPAPIPRASSTDPPPPPAAAVPPLDTAGPRVGGLTAHELARRLRTGLALRSGPFVFRIQSRLGSVAENLHRLYADHPLAEEDFADFHVCVRALTGLRRLVRPQAQFELDGQRPFKPLPLDQAHALLEWGMNWCIANHAHHYLILHAAVLARNGHALLLPGEPGAGKSTLTAALMLDGWRLLSDELTLIDRHDGLVYGLARPVSLKNASIAVIRAHAPQAVFGTVARDTHKGTVAHLKPTADSVARVHEPARPAWIVFPRWRPDTPARLTPHDPGAAFLHLASHAFNYAALGRLGFELTARLMASCSCWEFAYSELSEALAVFRDLAEGRP
ncbi:MAG: HprK-related kinase A [Thiobacillaceae bacterium]|nr:HprK-related kinase A [Thiobacillaceae bacterium]